MRLSLRSLYKDLTASLSFSIKLSIILANAITNSFISDNSLIIALDFLFALPFFINTLVIAHLANSLRIKRTSLFQSFQTMGYFYQQVILYAIIEIGLPNYAFLFKIRRFIH